MPLSGVFPVAQPQLLSLFEVLQKAPDPRDHLGLLTLAQHEDGAPQAVAVYDQKEGTPRCEQVVATALHCQKANARAVVEKGGDYLFQVKGNQPGLLAQAQALDARPRPAFLPRRRVATAG